MGRVKNLLVKRTAWELMRLYSDRFTTNFDENKIIVSKLAIIPSKRIRNSIAGYVTRLIKKSKGPKKKYIKQAEDLARYYTTNTNQDASIEA